MSILASAAAAGVPAVIDLIRALTPSLSTASSGVVTSTIKVLAEWGPLIVSQYKALKPVVSEAIEMLSNNTATTAEQIQQLRELSRKYDADFDAAVVDSRAGDKDAGYT